MAKSIEQAMQHAQDLVNDYASQKEMMEDVDKMYFMDWDDKPSGREFKFTTSPSARNALLGAIRLMTSTEPLFNVPYDKNKKEAKAPSEKIEKLCKTVWYHSGRFRGVPLEQPAIESLLRYGMMCLAITDTEDLKKMFDKKGASKAQKQQIQRLVDTTPYLVEAWDPKGVYPEWGRFGLNSLYRTVQMTIAEVIDQFGENVVNKVLSLDNYTPNEIVQYADYWDLEKHMAWISSTASEGETIIAGDPIVDENHNLPCIPIIVQTSEGSYIDSEREYQAMPFLYTILKGDLWERQNLELTYMYTNLFNLAANPTYLYQTIGEDELDVDYSIPGGVIKLRPGEQYRMLEKDVVNKDMLQGLQVADRLFEESTIFRQALGGMGGLGANAAFSTVSLLHQVGRLPLVSPQKRGGWGIGSAMETMFYLMKDKGKKRKLKTKEGFMEFDPDEIPDDLIIESRLEVDLPQDQMNQANIAHLVTQAGLASRRWAREKILNIGQSDEMDKEIWNDQASAQEFERILSNFMREQMMREEAMRQQGQQQGAQMPPEGMPPQGMPQQGPPMRGMVSPGSAMQAQAGLTPAQRPGTRPAPPTGEGMPLQEGEM
jgi:hypothetical protein